MSSHAAAEPAKKSGTSRGRFGRVAKANVVPHGLMSNEQAEIAYRAALTAYGLGDTTEEQRLEFLGCLTEALAFATSTEVEYSQVSFEYEGSRYALDVLDDATIAVYSGENPLRTWVKSFRDAQMCLRISDFLDTPENVGVRQVAAARYGMPVADAKYCFDCADGLLRTDRTFSYSEAKTIEMAKSFATSRAQGRAVVVGGSRPVQNSASNVGHVDANAAGEASSEARAGFKSVR